MDQEKIGKFILEMRKQKGLTQKELAEMVGISDKTISKWECGNSMPDISYLEPLCNSLGISVNELLSGQCLTGESYSEKAEENIMALMKENESNRKESVGKIVWGIILALVSVGGMILACSNWNELLYCWNYFIDGLGMVVYAMLCVSLVILSGKKTRTGKLEVIQKIAIPAGVLFMVVQITIMWHRLDDFSAIGPAVSVATLEILYGVVTYLVVTLLLERGKKEEA